MVMWGRHASRAGLSASATASANVLSASFYHNRLLEPYAARASRKLALKTLLQFGEGMTERKLLQSANYVRLELPTRVAHRIRNMQKLPFVVGTNIHIMSVYEKLWGTFERLSKVKEVTSAEENSAFCDLLREITVDQENATLELALGMGKSHVYMGEEDVNLFMNTMIRSHISRRFLALQHIKLSEAPAGSLGGLIGVISPSIKAADIASSCASRARELSRRTYGLAPPIAIEGDLGAEMTGVPEHLQHVIYELLKNSVRATVEANAAEHLRSRAKLSSTTCTMEDIVRYSDGAMVALGDKLPPISVCIAKSDDEIVFRVSDRGGGMDHAKIPSVWKYFFTLNSGLRESNPELSEPLSMPIGPLEANDEPMAALGCGMPIARMYAEYFGGTLQLHTLHGYGCDAYFYSKRHAEDQMESLI